MSTTGTIPTSALEERADRARERVADDVAALRRRSEHAVEHAGRMTRGSSRVLFGLALARLALYALPRPRIRRRPRIAASTATGTMCGLAAGAMMTAASAALRVVTQRVAPGEPERAEAATSQRPATVQAAQALLGPLPEEQRPAAGSIAHYAMAGATGAVYGMLSARAPGVRAGRGLAFGVALWLLADEIAVPALRFGSFRAPIGAHLRGLYAHLVYGATLEGLMRLVRPRLKMK